MARVSDEELERLKREVSLERLVMARGVELQKRGGDLVGRCPFHEDKTPSFVVTPTKNLWHCLGACRSGGSVIDFVMRAEGVNFRHAVELLREGVSLSGPVGPKVATVPKLPCPVSADVDDAQLLAQVRDYYHSSFKGAVEAWAYLEKRGLRNEELIHHFKLGFANRTLGLRLPDKNRSEGAAIRGRLEKLGVFRETSGHEHLNGCLVVPLHDEAGQVLGMYGRKVTEALRAGTPLHLYLPGPHRSAFNSAALAKHTSAIVCEALFDALSFWAAGFRNVTAAYGVEGFTAHHLDALKRHGVKDVLIAFDRDDAGDAGAEALAKKLMPEGFSCWRVVFPKGMDANEYAVKVAPAAKSLGVALRQAAWMGKGAPAGTPSFRAAVDASTGVKPAAVSSSAARLSAALPATTSTVPAAQISAAEPVSSSVPPKAPELQLEEKEDELVFHFGLRRYRVRGLPKALSAEVMKLNVLVSGGEQLFHVDTLDMYSARARAAFVREAAIELRVHEDALKRELGALLLKLEELQEQQLKEKLAPKNAAPALSVEETTAALELLKAPNLLQRVVADFARCGVVGE
ncbi:MAG: toprim domain-containing protein, partial [Myxococcaceae bacterium]|nr:toprim domain-containing protein [Myxococcaceae bacterium]